MDLTDQKEKVQTTIRVKESIRKKINDVLKRVNDKTYGRKVFPSMLIDHLLKFVDESIIEELQEKSLRHTEQVDRQYKQYIQKFGYVPREEFEIKRMELFKQWANENLQSFSY